MFNLDLKWKEFNINLAKVKEWLNENIETQITGLSGNSMLQIHFLEEPSEVELELIIEYWNELDEESDEAISYKSGEQVTQEEREAKLELIQSAKTKLAALGLSEAEISAILGV